MNAYTKMIIEICHNYYFIAKFAFSHEIEPNTGKDDKEIILQITENSSFGH